MDYQESKLRKELAGTGVSVTRAGDEIILNMPGNVTFDTDRAEIRPDFYPVLNSVVKVVTEYDKTIIEVSGFTDSTGSDPHNQELSQRRADAVGGYVKGQGINPGARAHAGLRRAAPDREQRYAHGPAGEPPRRAPPGAADRVAAFFTRAERAIPSASSASSRSAPAGR